MAEELALGTEEASAHAEKTALANKVELCCQFEATASVTLNVLKFWMFSSSNNSSSLKLCVRAENGGEPGNIIGKVVEANSKEAPEGYLSSKAGEKAEAPITKGQKYWLSVVVRGTGGLKYGHAVASGGTSIRLAKGEVEEQKNGETWLAAKATGPLAIAGFGEPASAGGPVTVKGGGGIGVAGYQQPQGAVKIGGGGAVKVTGAAAVTGRVTVGGGGKVVAVSEAKVIPPVKIAGGGKVKVTGYQQPTATVKVRGGGSVLVEASQYYHYGPGAQETFEAFPATKPGSPMVLAFHGGGWAGKANDLLETKNKVCVPLQTNGCATFNVFYHTPTETTGSFPESVENLVAGVQYIIARAESYNGNPGRVFLFGNSAGGHLAAMVYEKLAAKGFPIAGVITYSGLPHLPDLFKETETYATSNEYIWGDEELIAHIQEALYQSLPVTVELECEAGSKVLKNVPWPVIKAMEDKKYVSSVSVQGGVQKSPVKGFPNGRHEEGIGEVEIESNAGASGTKVVCIIEINQVTAELSNTTKAREWQEQWSPAIQPVSGFAKWLIISSEKEVVGPATSQALQEHLEAEGVWDKRCKRILRTASKAEQHANGFEEIIGENPAEGKGHALAYWTEQKPTILAFLFADEAAVVRGGGAVKVAGFQQPQGPVKIGGGGRVKVTSSSAASAHVTVAGGGSTVVRGFQQPQASPVIHGGGRVVIHGEVFSGALVHVTGGGAVKATGYQQPAGGVKIRGGGRVVFHTPAPATPAYCYAVTVPATYSYAAVTP